MHNAFSLLAAYNLSGIALTDEALDYEPWKIELDLPHDGLWISSASHGVVEYRGGEGTLRARADGLARPFTIAVDAGREEAWVVLAGGDQVICLDAAAQVLARLESLPAPSGVAFDPMRDEVWVTTLGGTDGDGSLWHFTRDGALLTRTRGLARPVAVALDVARP